MQLSRDLLVEGQFGLEAASLIQGNLDDQQAVAALDVRIGRIIDQAAMIVFSNHLKMVVGGNSNGAAHSLVDNLPNACAKVGRFAFHQLNTNKWHHFLPFGSCLPSNAN